MKRNQRERDGQREVLNWKSGGSSGRVRSELESKNKSKTEDEVS